MASSSASGPSNGKYVDASRQLPGLRELLTPALRHEPASPNRYPPHFAASAPLKLLGAFTSSTQAAPLPLPPPPPPPPSQPWHNGQRSSLPHTHVFKSDQRAASVHLPNFTVQQQPSANSFLPPVGYPTQAQRPSISGPDHRASIPAHPSDSQEDSRRDSARSNSTYSASNVECLGQQHFPGRGLCYVYSDGSTCSTVIDGEAVNPMWGTTKAGKARKRLAQACLNCREKKIRCEPRQVRCVQCEKSKRECIMPSQQSQSELSVASAASTSLPILSPALNRQSPPESTSVQAFKRRRSDERGNSVSPQNGSQTFSVRPKLDTDGLERAFAVPNGDNAGVRMDGLAHEGALGSVDVDWNVDPYTVSPDDTLRLLNNFFAQSITTCITIVPKHAFLSWAASDTSKKPDERMVLLCMLALGATLAKDTSGFARSCSERATKAVASRFGSAGVLLAQARLLLSVYEYVRGHDTMASEYHAGATNALKLARLHTEDGCSSAVPGEGTIFGLKPQQLIETKRRAFWAVFLLDRHMGAYKNSFSALPNDIVQLRLPCSDVAFDSGFPSRAPFFETDLSPPFSLHSPQPEAASPVSHIINMGRISEYVDHFIVSNSYRSSPTFAADYEVFHRNVDQQISRWFAALPPDLHISSFSLGKAVQNDLMGLVTAMFSLYHLTVMRYCRYTRHKLLDCSLRTSNVQRASSSAHQVLGLAHTICSFGQNLPEGQTLQYLISPTFSTAVYHAIDIISAGGSIADLRNLVGAVMEGYKAIQIVSCIWPFAKSQLAHVEQKLSDLQALFYAPDRVPADITIVDGTSWRCLEPFHMVHEADYDLIYGIQGKEFLQALRL